MRSSKSLCIFPVALLLFVFLNLCASAAQVTVTMMLDPRVQYATWQKAVVDLFQKEHPNIKVDLVAITGDATEQMLTMLAAGTPLNIAYHDPYAILDFARAGYLEDLAPYMAKETQYRDWYPASVNLFKLRSGQYGLPRDLQLGAVFYNQTLFEENGVTLPSEDWTYDDMLTMARRLTKQNADGTFARWGFRIPGWRNWVNIIWGFGGDFVDDWSDPTRFTGNSAPTIKALEYLAGMVQSKVVQDKVTQDKVNVSTSLQQQTIAMGMTNTSALPGMSKVTNFTWDIAPYPGGPGGRIAFINSVGWFMFKDAKNKAEAWELLKYFTSPKAVDMITESANIVPPSRSKILNVWLPRQKMPAHIQLFMANLEFARGPGLLTDDVFKPIQAESDAVIWGLKAAPAAIESMTTQVNAALAKMKKR